MGGSDKAEEHGTSSDDQEAPVKTKRGWFRRRKGRRRLKFTREGKYFVAIAIGIGLAATNTGNNLLYLLLGWLLSMIIASGALSDMTLRRLRVSRRAPSRIFANRPFLMEVAVENRKKRLASFSVEIEDIQAGRPVDKRCYYLKVPAGKTQKTKYRHTFSRRGRYHFDGYKISTRFPFALFIKHRRISGENQVIVFPEVRAMPAPTPRAQKLGDAMTNRVGRRGEFFGLREYREGDDRRQIHWRSTARTGQLLVRELEEEAQRRVTLVIDNALPVGADDIAELALERAISLVASLGKSYLDHGYAVRLVARGDQLIFGAGPAHTERLLYKLALLETTREDTEFTGRIDPRAESVLIAPAIAGFAPEGRPAVTEVMMQGAAA